MCSQKAKASALSWKSMSHEEIRKGFDPNYFYIIFERNKISENIDVFEKINMFLQSVKGVISKEFYSNKKERKLYLVVKINPIDGDNIVDKLYSIKLSKNCIFYTYGTRLKD